MTEGSVRRHRVILFCLGVIAAGALLKLVADPRTLASDVGTLLLGVSLAAAAFFAYQLTRKRSRVALDFDAAAPFAAHVAVELTLRQQPHRARIEGKYRGIFVVGTQGFTARFVVPPGAALEPGTPQRVEAQFLRPEAAWPHFPVGGMFSLLEGKHLVADGRMLERLC